MKTSPTIGILAGMGPRSTAPFLDLVVNACARIYGARHDDEFPRMLICSQPAPFYEDRPIDHQALEAAIRDGLLYLEAAGVDFLAIACNTAHIYLPSLRAAVATPLLDIVGLAVAALPADARRIALVAARPTAESGLFQRALAADGREALELAWQAAVDALLGAVRDPTDPATFHAAWSQLFAQARAAGADALLVACLDLSGVLRHAPAGLPVVDAAEALATAIVEEWLRRKASPP